MENSKGNGVMTLSPKLQAKGEELAKETSGVLACCNCIVFPKREDHEEVRADEVYFRAGFTAGVQARNEELFGKPQKLKPLPVDEELLKQLPPEED